MAELNADTLTLGLIWFVVFLFSTTCHEGAHALVAKLGGDTTASAQVTLNPIPHIKREPTGMVVVPVLSYLMSGSLMGWASAPYDPVWAYRHPHRAARMALAGPAANFTLMILAALAIRAGVAAAFFQAPDAIRSYSQVTEAMEPAGIGSLLATVVSVLFVLNLLLGVLNLIPLAPLDGSVGITLFMSEERARRFMEMLSSPNLRMMGLVAAILFGRVFGEIFWPALNVLYYGIVSYG